MFNVNEYNRILLLTKKVAISIELTTLLLYSWAIFNTE